METLANEIKAGLNQFHGSQVIYSHPHCKTKYTEGIQYLAERAKCYWLLTDASIVAKSLKDHSYFITIDVQRFLGDEAIRNECEAIVTYSDGNGNILFEQRYSATDFPLDQLRLYFVDDTLLLPSEY